MNCDIAVQALVLLSSTAWIFAHSNPNDDNIIEGKCDLTKSILENSRETIVNSFSSKSSSSGMNISTYTSIDGAVFYVALIILVGSGVIVGIIDKTVKPRDNALQRQRTRYLWKFHLNSAKDMEEMIRIDRWSMAKLWFAGCMIASTMIIASQKRLKNVSVYIGTVVFMLWNLFLLYFWYFEVRRKYDMIADSNMQDDDTREPSNKKENSNLNSSANIDRMGDEIDQRLPLTIITGFLGSGE